MPIPVVILICVSIPLLFFAVMFGPIYASMCVGLYLYDGELVLEYLFDPGFIIDRYQQLTHYWGEYSDVVEFTSFILPLFGPLTLGFLLALGLFYLVIRYIQNVFVLTS